MTTGRTVPPEEHSIGPAVAGDWYPRDADALSAQIARLVGPEAQAPSDPSVIALIAPHAAYRYSGAVAARVFRLLRGRSFARVLVVGPAHHFGYSGAALPDAGIYRTPLGDIPLDTPAIEALAAQDRFRIDSRMFAPEHSLEMQLPFLQHLLTPGWRLLPVLVSQRARGEDGRALARALAPFAGPRTLLVASSDFTHFGRAFGFVPFERDIPARIRALDEGAIERVVAGDADGFEEYCARSGATVCGRDAIALLLRLLPAGARAELAAYDTSGDLTGDWSHSVSYAALAIRAHSTS